VSSNRARGDRSTRTQVLVGTEHTHAVDHGLRNAYFAKHGLLFLVDLHHNKAHQQIVAPESPQLALWG
jgi:hypothetical protein